MFWASVQQGKRATPCGRLPLSPAPSPCRAAARFMEAEETRAAEALAQRATQADRVGRLGLSVRLAGVRAAPVYVPAYVFRSMHFGSKLRTFVSGGAPRQAQLAMPSPPAPCLAHGMRLSTPRFVAGLAGSPDRQAPVSTKICRCVHLLIWTKTPIPSSGIGSQAPPCLSYTQPASLACLAARRGRPAGGRARV